VTLRFLDLRRLHDSVREDLRDAFERVVDESSFVGGPEVDAFEREFARELRLPGVVGCASGTAALELSLRALGIGRGDEVIVPAMTFVATAEAVLHVGAVPVLADVDPTSLLLTERTVEAVRTDTTRAVVPVHLYGHPVSRSAILAWRADGLTVVEDAAQAVGAGWNGRSVGDAGHAAAFSFYPGKNLGALGDAGAAVSGDDVTLHAMRSLRDHGRHGSRDQHDVVGWNARLDGLQAAFLRAKLPRLRAWTAAREALATHYRQQLETVDSASVVPWEHGSVHHLFVIRVPARARDRLRKALAQDGIETRVHYGRALSQHPSLREWHRPCPHSEAAASQVLSLPLDPVMPLEETEIVSTAVARALATSS